MRVVQYARGVRRIFFARFLGDDPAQRSGSGAESGAGAIRLALLLGRSVQCQALVRFSLSKSFPLSPLSQRCSSSGSLREAVRSVSPLWNVFGQGAMHQLLSGQLRQSPTPTVSYLYDGGDRGLRPF